LNSAVNGYATGLVARTVDLFVDPVNGRDSWPGTIAYPVATVRQALRLCPAFFTRWCRIWLLAGTTNEGAGDLYVNPPQPIGPDAQPLTIIGVMADVGLGVQTVTSFALNGTPSPQGAGDLLGVAGPLATDLYAGAEVRMLSGAASGYAYQAMTNQLGAFYLPHDSHDALPAPGDTFRVTQPSSIIGLGGGQIHFCSGVVSIYGVAISSLIVDIWPGAEVCASNLSFLGVGSVLVQGKLSPGLAQFVSSIPTAPSNATPSALGFYANKSVNVAYGGVVGRAYIALSGGFPGVGCIVIRNGGLFGTGAYTVAVYTADVPRVSMGGPGYFLVSQHWRVNGSPSHGILGQAGAMMIVAQVDVSGCAGDGIRLDAATLTNGQMLVGSGNTGVGLRALHGGRAAISDPQDVTTISGNNGAVVVGSKAAVPWQRIKDGLEADTTDSKTLCYVGV